MQLPTELRSLAVWVLTAPASGDTLLRLADRLSALAQQEEERHAGLVVHQGALPEGVIDLRDPAMWESMTTARRMLRQAGEGTR